LTRRRATTLIALTDAERRAFARLAPDVPCRVVPNGVDVPPSESYTGAAERVAQRYGIPPDAPLILFLSRIHEWKGVEQLLEAFRRIQARHPDAVLVMAGPDECEAERRWSVVAAEMGFASRLLFPGVVTGKDKNDLLARADLFCLPSHGEGFSMAVLEAMACATPVLLTSACNFDEAVEAGAGRISSSDPEALAPAIEEMLGDRDALRHMGEAGRRLVIESYSWDSITDRLLEVYEEGIARARKGVSSVVKSVYE
jgi:glycosyltransferase involved in cell wall biosynthesis